MIRRMDSKYWQNKNVFVTGATGFLGSWLVKHLVDSGANVAALVRDVVHHSNLYRSGYANKISLVYGELENYLLLERAFGEYETEAVFHAGAQTIVEIANRNPLSTFETNIRGTVNVLEASRRTPTIKKVIVASSDKAYGVHEKLPYSETAPLQGKFPYDVSKSAADLIAQSYHATYKLPVTITRCGNFYGGGDLNFNRIVPGAIRAFLMGEPPVIRSDGKFIRDYFYIEDAAEAYLHLAKKMDAPAIHGNAFNFSPGNLMTPLEIVASIKKLMKSDIEPVVANTARSEIRKQYLSSEKAETMLGWKSKYEYEDGLKKTVEWYKAYFKDRDEKKI